MTEKKQLRTLAEPFVADGPSGVAIRTRLKNLTERDEEALRELGGFLGHLAARDLAKRCADGSYQDKTTVAARRNGLTSVSSSRWASSIVKATDKQWSLSRRCQQANIENLEAGIAMLRHRLSQAIGSKGTKKAPGGYHSKNEWFRKSRRLAQLTDRLFRIQADEKKGIVRIVRGGRKLLNSLAQPLTSGEHQKLRETWESKRLFLTAIGDAGQQYGNPTICVAPDGTISVNLPSLLSNWANSDRGRRVLACKVSFAHRGDEWRSRVEAGQAVAYTVSYDPGRARWYLTAAWRPAQAQAVPLETARASGMIGVDTNAGSVKTRIGNFAAYRLDTHGNPVGNPQKFDFDLSGKSSHRDAQIRHAISQLLHWVVSCGISAIAIENLNFDNEKTREKHGRKKQFKQLISGFPTAKLRARLISMATELGISIVAVDPAYTSMWGRQHWQKPLATQHREMTSHSAAAVAIGRRALGHQIRRNPPGVRPEDRRRPRARPDARKHEEARQPVTDRRTPGRKPDRSRKAGDQHA